MADDLRFGLEMEFHGIVMTLKKRNANEFWPAPASSTLVGSSPILVPSNDTTFLLNGKTNWEGDWGFRAVGDRFAHPTVCGRDAGTCVLELATAANTVGNSTHWTSVRLCAKEFVAVMENFKDPNRPRALIDGQSQWYPLFDFVDLYNQRVQLLKPRPGFGDAEKSKFQLKASIDLVSLAAGTFPGRKNEVWDAYISTNNAAVNPLGTPFCDIQINYQVDLEWLDQHTEDWIGLWNSMWVYTLVIQGQPLDPNIGITRTTAAREVYRTQQFAALWRMAKDRAGQHVAEFPARAQPIVRALITYLMAAGSISVEEAGGSTSKNSFPQLPKTSPASIGRLIAAIYPDAVGALRHLATDDDTIETVKNAIRNTLRNPARLVDRPGLLSPLSPQAGSQTYVEYPAGMLTGEQPSHFEDVWSTSLNPNGPALDPATNLSGFTSADPFYCAWAEGVKTSYPAARRGDRGIKMLFEGRYGTDKLNIGFNPYVRDFMFNRSYLSMVRTLANPAAVAPAVAAITQMFPDEPAVRQNFPDGAPH